MDDRLTMAPPAVLDHPGDGVLAGEHDALQVYVYHRVPKLFVHVSDRARAGNAHVVNQHVELAEIVYRRLGHGGAVGVAGNVADEDRRVAALFLDGSQGDFGVLLVPVHQQHLCAVPGEKDGDRLADAHEVAAAGGPGAGDYGYFAV